MMTFSDINFLGILVAGIAAMVVGGLWYGPIMGKAWLTENNLKAEDIGDSKAPMIKGFISNLFLAFGIWVIISHTGIHGWSHGAMVGGFLALFIHGAGGYPNYAFENRSDKLFMIHLGNSFIGMSIMGAILGTW